MTNEILIKFIIGVSLAPIIIITLILTLDYLNTRKNIKDNTKK